MKLYMNKNSRRAIERAMSKTQRADMENGSTFRAIIKRHAIRHLIRWGDDENIANIIFKKNGEILYNSLENLAGNWDNAIEAAKNAIDYFVYGKKCEYTIIVTPFLDKDIELSKEESDKLGLPTNYEYTLMAWGQTILYNDKEGTWYKKLLGYNHSCHCGEDQGCFWSEWVDEYGNPIE